MLAYSTEINNKDQSRHNYQGSYENGSGINKRSVFQLSVILNE